MGDSCTSQLGLHDKAITAADLSCSYSADVQCILTALLVLIQVATESHAVWCKRRLIMCQAMVHRDSWLHHTKHVYPLATIKLIILSSTSVLRLMLIKLANVL